MRQVPFRERFNGAMPHFHLSEPAQELTASGRLIYYVSFRQGSILECKSSCQAIRARKRYALVSHLRKCSHGRRISPNGRRFVGADHLHQLLLGKNRFFAYYYNTDDNPTLRCSSLRDYQDDPVDSLIEPEVGTASFNEKQISPMGAY